MFFTAIHQMMTEGVDLTLVIRKANGQLTVSLLPKSNGLKDEAQNHLVPLTVSGHPQELDAGFLQAVARPIQKTTGLISNMAQFEAQAEKAASESKAAKETKAKETKEEKEKREKYEKHFKKAEELIAAKNHKEAVTALGQARLYAKPQDQKKIDEMVAEQTKAMNKGSLFELMEEPAQQPQQPQATGSRTSPTTAAGSTVSSATAGTETDGGSGSWRTAETGSQSSATADNVATATTAAGTGTILRPATTATLYGTAASTATGSTTRTRGIPWDTLAGVGTAP